jgi:2-haloacid dehalogenase
MHLDRRKFTTIATAGIAAAVRALQARATESTAFKAIAFDGFAIIDARPVFMRAEAMFPDNGKELSNVWRARQFEYGWLRSLSGRYTNFWRVTEDALLFAARSLQIELSSEQRDRLMQTYLELEAWPDVLPALKRLRETGIRMAFLSNLTAAMLDAVIKNSGLEGLFEDHLTTDRVGAFKPDPRAYQMAVDSFGLKKEQIAFTAFAGWDAAGAKWFGYPTFWVNRTRAPAEELGITPDGTGPGLGDLVKFVIAS